MLSFIDLLCLDQETYRIKTYKVDVCSLEESPEQ